MKEHGRHAFYFFILGGYICATSVAKMRTGGEKGKEEKEEVD